eukprot:479110_1
MAVNLQNLCNIDQDRKDTVFGFIKQNFAGNICHEMILICVLFYGHDDVGVEEFELHFTLQIDYAHALEQNHIIQKCIAEIMNKYDVNVYFNDSIKMDSELYGLLDGYISTRKNQPDKLTAILKHSLSTNILQNKIQKRSHIVATQIVKLKECYDVIEETLESGFILEQSSEELSDDTEQNRPTDNFGNADYSYYTVQVDEINELWYYKTTLE